MNIPALLEEILSKGIYKQDYDTITNYFQNQPLSYDEAITAIRQIEDCGAFDTMKQDLK